MNQPVCSTTCSLSTLFLLGFLDESDILEGGNVSHDKRLRAEALYKTARSRLLNPVRSPDVAHRIAQLPSLVSRSRNPTLPPPAVPLIDLTDANEEEDLKSSDVMLCSICMTRKKEHACLPCGHFCMCTTCSLQLDGRCPICRTAYSRIQRIFTT